MSPKPLVFRRKWGKLRMPDAEGRIRPVAIPDIPWHEDSREECSFDTCPYSCGATCRYPANVQSAPPFCACEGVPYDGCDCG